MRSLVGALTRGQGGIALTVGDAGAGKSALLRAVFRASDRDHRVIWISGDELSQVFPLLPFAEAVTGPHKAELNAVLRGGAGISDPALAASEILVGWVDELCTRTPVVLVFDDLHWADEASVRLWNRLTRLAEQSPLLVVGSMRPAGDRADLGALVRRAGQLAAIGRGVLAELEPLSPQDSVELVAGLVGGTPGDRLTALVSAAGGNPLYLTELAGALMRDGALSGHSTVEVESGQRPDSLTSVISARFDSVPPDVRDLLRMAALLGVEFTVTDLSVASSRPVAELAGMLDRAESAGLLATTKTGLKFRHPLLRDVLCDQVAGSVRAAWHQEVGRALAKAGQAPATVARQLLAAVELGGELSTSDWLIDWLVAEGEGLANQSAAVARTLFTRAMRRLPLSDARRARIATPLVSALLRGGDPVEAERLARQTLDAAQQADADTRLKLGTTIIDSAQVAGRPHDALEMLDRLDSEPDWTPQQRLRLLVLRGMVHLAFSDRRDGVPELAEEALAQAQRLADPWAAATACHTLAMAGYNRGRVEDMLRHSDEGLALVVDDPELLDVYMSLLADRSLALLTLCRWDEARSTTVRLRALAERTGNERRLQQCVVSDVMRLFDSGGWTDMLSEVAAATPEPAYSACFERAAVAALHRDDVRAAEQYLEAVDEILGKARWTSTQGSNRTEWTVIVRSFVLEHSGDRDAAVDLVLAAVEGGLWQTAYMPTAHGVRLALECGRRADAEKLAAFGMGHAAESVRSMLVPHCRGLLDNDPELLASVAEAYAERGLVPCAAEAWESAGLAWAARGEQKQARRAMAVALEGYESLGAVWDLQRVRAAFREHGLRTGAREPRNRPASGWQSLTATETRVAHLVAEGRSNRMIAEQLFLSRRTVDTHVSHILAKLGLRSRVDVAKLAVAEHR
ncbi:LuxR family transcriptional regulator [Lentzea sp. NBRC 105346]|nr:LuxR family transcriptional regulator [Lentzea sp. NBRC 105346]